MLAALAMALVVAIAPSSASAVQSITVTPDTGLSSPATVEVSGSGWPASSAIGIRQCTGDNIIRPGDCTAPLAGVNADGTGSFGPVGVTVTRTFVGDTTGGTIDCGVVVCVIWAINGAGTHIAQKTIAFAPPPSATTPPAGTSPPPSQQNARRRAAIARCKKKFEKGDPKRKRCLAKARKQSRQRSRVAHHSSP